ncbi:MAG: AmmeMemoRadiSam system protein B [Treponema sp.]|jgi:AmmeMemoRadiSam system protein B|nr:AmmeMemoRadiSam system protein B [Treponema sp.]
MRIRDYSLPAGWHPRDPSEISGTIARFISEFEDPDCFSRAAIAPHAGWYYCGRLAAQSVSCLDPQAETVAVFGGHLPASSPPLFAMEDAVKTPFDPMPIDNELRAILLKDLNGAEDRFADNTVEVLLPMVRFFFPNARLLWLRLPAGMASFDAGKIVARTAANINRKINVLSSTDLTHYGLNYGFLPHGTGEKALNWVRDVNDANFIKAVESGVSEDVLKSAQRDHSACSAGAVLGAMGFADALNLGAPRLIKYATSADAAPDSSDVPDSFVGYAAFSFCG